MIDADEPDAALEDALDEDAPALELPTECLDDSFHATFFGASSSPVGSVTAKSDDTAHARKSSHDNISRPPVSFETMAGAC